ncbi:MAG: signal peptide peptidase SppA [Pseudomonadota bacterium]
MLRLLKGIWHTITMAKNATTNLLFLLITVLVLVAVFSTETVSIPEQAALVLDPTGFIVEQRQALDPVARFLAGTGETEPETLQADLLTAIQAAADDSRIKLMVLKLDGLAGASMSALEEVGNAIDAFRATGKPVYSFAPGYTQTQYYLAAHADEILLDSHSFQAFGGVFLTGFGIYPTYLKGALDKLKIRYHVFSVGEYKDAVEPYTREGMSDASRVSNQAWLDELWDEYTTTVTTARHVSAEQFDRYTNAFDEVLGESGNDAQRLAVDAGLVDELISRDGFNQRLIEIVGEREGDFRGVGFRDYLRATQPPIPVTNPTLDKIAVIIAKGTILDGEQPAGNIGGDTLARLIHDARVDKAVKALVVRVDSPGGSASAAERIRAELELTQQAGKPVVISMSGYAASGGYWIAATANRIFAQQTTLTGSIGTFLAFPTFDAALAEFGINSDGVGTTALSGSLDVLRPINPVLERTLQRSVRHTYDRFIQIVANGRDLDLARVDEIGQGRVWTGKKALELGLVDAIGNLDDAIASAAQLAGVREHDVIYLQQELSPRELILNELMQKATVMLSPSIVESLLTALPLSALSRDLGTLLTMSRSGGIYVQCIYCGYTP